MKWLDRFLPKDNDGKGNKGNNNRGGGGGFPNLGNLGAGLGGGNAAFRGSGQSLGGSQPGDVIPITLSESGSLGIQIERRPNSAGTAIVSYIVPGGQADRAGLRRGDILCFAGSNGSEEIMYDMFIELAKSTQRPLCFEVRRVKTKAAAGTTAGGRESAEAYSRKQAVIAAAEAREKAHKKQSKPIAKIGDNGREPLTRKLSKDDDFVDRNEGFDNAPKSEASRMARDAAKLAEQQTAQQLGYNPYEINHVTSGQARNATVNVKHGTMEQQETPNGSSNANTNIPTVRPPVDPTTSASENGQIAPPQPRPIQVPSSSSSSSSPPPSQEFERAMETVVTSSSGDAITNSLSIMRKLLVNATTKGQQQQQEGEDDTSSKFRRVRLANTKIRAAIVDVDGAFDLMISAGFQLIEEDGESLLVYPYTGTTTAAGPTWLPSALKMMESYEKSST